MSGSQTKITITHGVYDVYGDLQSKFITAKMSKEARADGLTQIIEDIAGGVRNGSIAVTIDDGTAASASGTITFSSFNTANDTVVINGVTFTAVASGATGNQWNIGASANAQASNLASAINSAASMAGIVTASAASAVVTITSAVIGVIGNAVTLAKGTDAGAVMTVGGLSNGRLSGGVNSANGSSFTDNFGV